MRNLQEILSQSYILNESVEMYDLDLIITKRKERPFIKLSNDEIHSIVKIWQTSSDPFIKNEINTVLLEHYLLLCRKHCKKYAFAYNGVKCNETYMDGDLINETTIILHKCLTRFTKTETGTFTAFLLSEVRNALIETARKNYFDVCQLPSHFYRKMRKDIIAGDDDVYTAKKMIMPNNPDETDRVKDLEALFGKEDTKFLNELEDNDFLGRMYVTLIKTFPKEDVESFIFNTGFIENEKVSIAKLAKLNNISASAMSNRLKRIREYIAKNKNLFFDN